MRVSGIYKIVNKINGKFYIGSSENIKKRWARHLYDFKRNSHHNIILQRAWGKYGEPAFSFEVIEETVNLLEREQFYIDILKPEYNLGVVGGGDNISKHPNLKQIKEKHSLNGRLHWEKKTELEKKEYGENLLGDKNPNWRGGRTFCDCGTRINSNANSCMNCIDRSGSKNSFYGKTHSEEVRKKLRLKQLGKKPTNQRSVNVDGVCYSSVTEASRQIKVCPATIIFRIKSQYWDYKYN